MSRSPKENTVTRLLPAEREKHAKEAAQWIATGFYADVLTELEADDTEIAEKIESPLEEIFWIWWEAVNQISNMQLHLVPQEKVILGSEAFRLDFVIQTDPDEMWEGHQRKIEFPKFAVELDGHEWHERTPEQVARRDRRDRLLQQHGWKVFHFSGREFLTLPVSHVAPLYAEVAQAYGAWRKKWHDAPAGGLDGQKTLR